MGVITPPGPQRIAINDVKTATKLILWTPFLISILAILLFALVRLVISCSLRRDLYLKRWSALRDWLAVKTSGGEFYDVYVQHSTVEGTTVNREASQSHVHERVSNVVGEKDLFMAERRIPAEQKGSWYNLYLLLLPVQVALITILIIHNIYDEGHYLDSCEAFAKIAGNLNESRFYDCSYGHVRENNTEIWGKCNNTHNTDDKVSCSFFSYNPLLSEIILTVLNTLLLHVTLAKGFVRVMILMRYIAHKINKTFFANRQRKESNPGAVILAIILILFMAIPFIGYAFVGDGSDLTTIMVFFAYTATAGSIVLFLLGLLFQRDLYEPFQRCVFNVTYELKAVKDETTNIISNSETVESNQTSRSCFCCLNKGTTSRDDYLQLS